MGVLDIFRGKKKKKQDDELPPPPPIIEKHKTPPSDFTSIPARRPEKEIKKLPPLKEAPPLEDLPELPPIKPKKLEEEVLPIPPPSQKEKPLHVDDFDLPPLNKEDIPTAEDFPELTEKKEKASIRITKKPTMKKGVLQLSTAKHLFVSSKEYSSIVDNTNKIRSTLLESDEYLEKLADLQGAEEKQLAEWQEQLENVEKKIERIETILAENSEV